MDREHDGKTSYKRDPFWRRSSNYSHLSTLINPSTTIPLFTEDSFHLSAFVRISCDLSSTKFKVELTYTVISFATLFYTLRIKFTNLLDSFGLEYFIFNKILSYHPMGVWVLYKEHESWRVSSVLKESINYLRYRYNQLKNSSAELNSVALSSEIPVFNMSGKVCYAESRWTKSISKCLRVTERFRSSNDLRTFFRRFCVLRCTLCNETCAYCTRTPARVLRIARTRGCSASLASCYPICAWVRKHRYCNREIPSVSTTSLGNWKLSRSSLPFVFLLSLFVLPAPRNTSFQLD